MKALQRCWCHRVYSILSYSMQTLLITRPKHSGRWLEWRIIMLHHRYYINESFILTSTKHSLSFLDRYQLWLHPFHIFDTSICTLLYISIAMQYFIFLFKVHNIKSTYRGSKIQILNMTFSVRVEAFPSAFSETQYTNWICKLHLECIRLL